MKGPLMAMPVTKVSVGKSGYGAAHASYITRFSALDPEGRDRTQTLTEQPEQLLLPHYGAPGEVEPTVSETLDDNLSERALNQREEH